MLIYQLVRKEDVDGFGDLFFLGLFKHLERYDIFDSKTLELQNEVA